MNHAFAWREGIVKDLGTLSGPANCSLAAAINSNGVILQAMVGGSATSTPTTGTG